MIRREMVMTGRTERGFEIPRARGAFDLIPRIAGIPGRGGRMRRLGRVVRGQGMIAGGVFVALFGVFDRIEQHDHGTDREEQYSDG